MQTRRHERNPLRAAIGRRRIEPSDDPLRARKLQCDGNEAFDHDHEPISNQLRRRELQKKAMHAVDVTRGLKTRSAARVCGVRRGRARPPGKTFSRAYFRSCLVMRNRAFFVALCAFVTFAFAGCGEPVRSIVLWHAYRGGEEKAIDQIAAQYENEN